MTPPLFGMTPRAGKIFSVPLATMEPLPKNQSPNLNQDLKPGRQSRTPSEQLQNGAKEINNTRTGTLSEKCKTLCTYCTSKVFAETKCMKGRKDEKVPMVISELSQMSLSSSSWPETPQSPPCRPLFHCAMPAACPRK